MSKLWRIAKQEFIRHLTERQFLFIALSLPALLLMLFGFHKMVSSFNTDHTRAFGYADHGGLLQKPLPAALKQRYERPVRFKSYPYEADAAAALKKRRIQGYFIVDKDYFINKKVEVVCAREVSRNVTQQFSDWIRINLLSDLSPEKALRAIAGGHTICELPDGSRRFEGVFNLGQLLPLFSGFAFVMLIFFSSGYLMQAIAMEKANRTLEVVLTSVSHQQLMGGKILGALLITFILFLVWAIFAGLAFFIGGQYLGVEWMTNFYVDFKSLLLMGALLLPSYVIAAALMAAIGAIISDAKANHAIMLLIVGFSFMPGLLLFSLFESPNSALAVSLTFIPFTAPMTLPFRQLLTLVPTWQIVLSIGLQTSLAVLSLWLAGRVFRLARLSYGQKLPAWRFFFGKGGN